MHEEGKGDVEAGVDAIGPGGVDVDPGEEPAIVGATLARVPTCWCEEASGVACSMESKGVDVACGEKHVRGYTRVCRGACRCTEMP
jgi:hypothetical protein